MKNIFAKLFGKERRKFQRFIVEEVTPVFMKGRQPEEAWVENISLDGICIKYSGEEEISDRIFDLDIKASDGFHLGKIAVERKSDSRIRPGKEDSRPFRRVRGRFIRVSKVQKLKLQSFLESYERKFLDE